jgi:hypothetical protein
MSVATTQQSTVTPPKVIRLHTKAYKDGKTLIWLRDQDVSSATTWKRWQSVVTSIEDYNKWHAIANVRYIVLRTITAEDVPILKAIPKDNIIFFITDDVLSVMPTNEWQTCGFQFVRMNGMFAIYPHLLHEWDGSLEDAVACIATVFLFRHIAYWNGSDARKNSLTVNNVRWKEDKDCVPPSLCVMTQYFVHGNAKRAREIRKCLMNNCSNPLVDTIVLLTETDLSREWASFSGREKIRQYIIGTRLTYTDLLRGTVDHVAPNTVVAYMNADIYLNDTIKHVFDLDMNDKMLALLRWDTDERGTAPVIFGPYCDSQDTWIVLSDSIHARARASTLDYGRFDYQLGRAGCDNRFTADMLANRFMIINPADTIQTLHIHTSAVRDYNRSDIIMSPYYVYPYNTQIYDTNLVEQCRDVVDKGKGHEYAVQIRCPTPANGVTWCTMIGRHGRFVWEHGVEHRVQPVRPVYSWSHAMATIAGIVYTTRDTYVGKSLQDFAKEANISLSIDPASTKTHVPLYYAVPVQQTSTFNLIDNYLLYYLSRAFQVGASTDMQGHFLAPPYAQGVIESFQRGLSQPMNAILVTPSTSIFSDRIVGYMPSVYEISRDDIQALRSHFVGWSDVIVPKTCVVLVNRTEDERISPFTDAVLDGIRASLGEGWSVDVMDINASGLDAYRRLVGKEMCVFFGGEKLNNTWPKLWALPARCKVVEFQNELKTHGEFQQMAGAADFDSWLITLHKGSGDEMRQQAVDKFQAWLASGRS